MIKINKNIDSKNNILPEAHVYCTHCIEGEKLLEAITDDKDIPSVCNNCNPYNPEDSCRFEKRPMYKPL